MVEQVVSIAAEPNFVSEFILSLPFYAAYFFGTIVRKFGFREYRSPPLCQQLILCIPFSLLLVTPLVSDDFFQRWGTFAMALGTFMIEGAFVTESAARYIEQRLSQGREREEQGSTSTRSESKSDNDSDTTTKGNENLDA